MIVKQLSRHFPARSVVVYHPTSASEKHRYYFDQLEVGKKYFVPLRPVRVSDTISDALVWWRIPRDVRDARYDVLFIASIGSISFSQFAARNPRAVIHTFDDGSFNLAAATYADWIHGEPIMRRVVKCLVGGLNNPGIVARASLHHTIFPRKLVVGVQTEIDELVLFTRHSYFHADGLGRKVRVLLGSWFADTTLQSRHDALVRSGKFDVFLPHPADSRSALMASHIRVDAGLIDLGRMVAEDVVAGLVKSGYRVVVYGFNSTALINLAHFVPALSIVLEPYLETIPCRVMNELGVRQLVCHGLNAE